MANQLDDIKAKTEELQDDAEKFFDKGNSAAGLRLRKGLQEIKKLATTLRAQITELKKASKPASE